jgi:diguanylate cyclase (GGDEF)-like protein/PAS domain S-box-containing protein
MTGLLFIALLALLLTAVRLRRREQPTESDPRCLFDAAPIATIVLDEHERIVHTNGAMARLLGDEAAALAGRTLAQFVHRDDVPLLRIGLAQLRHDICHDLGTEVRLVRADRTSVAASLHAAVLGDGLERLTLVQLLDMTERKRAEAQLRELADHDALTGVLNRRCFTRELERHISHARRYGAEGAVLVLDADHFKQVNDTAGHGAGDRLLVQVAEALRTRLRGTDVIARLGGDEFAILLPRADRTAAEAVARSLVGTVREDAHLDGTSAPVTISVGVAMVDAATPATPEVIVAAADGAMYRAKHAGGDTYAFADALDRPSAALAA